MNTGCGTAIRELQGVLGVSQCCCFDNDTSAALWKFVNETDGAGTLVDGILERRTAYYREIVSANSKLEKFLDGWLRRVATLKDAISALGSAQDVR